MEPEDPQVNTGRPADVDYHLSPANALVALSRSAPDKDLSNVQIPTGSASDKNKIVCSHVSVPISTNVNMPVLTHAYAASPSPGQSSGLEQ